MNNSNSWFRYIKSAWRVPIDHETAPLRPRELPPSWRTPVSSHADFGPGDAVTSKPPLRELAGTHSYLEPGNPEVAIPRAARTMDTTVHRFDFNFSRLDTLVMVEKRGDGIVIHATRDTFSPERKENFIRALAAEGFIPDDFRWFSMARWPDSRQVCWHVADESSTSAKNELTQRIVTGVLGAMALLCMGWPMLLRLTGH
jgi:hypothetical protein